MFDVESQRVDRVEYFHPQTPYGNNGFHIMTF